MLLRLIHRSITTLRISQRKLLCGQLVNPYSKFYHPTPRKFTYVTTACFFGALGLSYSRARILSVKCQEHIELSALSQAEIFSNEETTWTTNDLLLLLVPEIFTIALSVLAAVTAAITNVLIPIHLGNLAENINDCFVQRFPISSIYMPACRLFTVYILQSLATFSYIGLIGAAGERIAENLRMQLFDKLLHRNMTFFDTYNAGKLMDNITSDVQSFKSSLKQCISQGLRGLTQVTGAVYDLFSISSPLTLTLLGCLPCIFLVGSLIGRELRRYSRKAQEQLLVASSVAEESFTHVRSVKSMNLEDAQLRRFGSELEKARLLSEHLGWGIGAFQGLSNLALNGMVLTVLFVGGHLVSKEQLRPGQLLSFLATTQTMQRSLAQLSMLYAQVLRGSTALSRIVGILKMSNFVDAPLPPNCEQSDFKLLFDKWHEPGGSPSIQFDSVQFSYPTRPDAPVLDSLNLAISSGQVVALVGKSGAGKSTVVSLLERFYDPSFGKITLDGCDIREFPLQHLRGQLIGYISQEPQIFNATIRENIRFGRPDATDQEVEEAARLANAHEFIIEQLPAGYDTLVGQGADSVAGLSGGQRQRIAIARVMLKNAPILVLDEATSALDAESESQVQEALRTVMKGRTVLVIAHRLSTVRKADRIVVMANGRIVEQGTHQQLMAKQGSYYQLVRTQTGEGLASW